MVANIMILSFRSLSLSLYIYIKAVVAAGLMVRLASGIEVMIEVEDEDD